MSSSTKFLVTFLSIVVLAKGDGGQTAVGKPLVAGYGYGISHVNYGQWPGSQYGHNTGVSGTYGSTAWPYNQGYPQTLYNNLGHMNYNYPYNGNQYGTNPHINRYKTFGATGYPNNNQYNSIYKQQLYQNKYTPSANPGFNRPWSNQYGTGTYNNQYGTGTYNNPYNTQWSNGYRQTGFASSTGFGNNGFYNPYRSNAFQYNRGVNPTLSTTIPKDIGWLSTSNSQQTFGTTGHGWAGQNNLGFDTTGQGYPKYGGGYKPWQSQDGKHSGVYGFQGATGTSYITSPGASWNQYGSGYGYGR